MTARLALVVATVMISATTALAQRADSLRIGARVRVQPIHRPPPQVAGEVVAVDSVGLTLKDSHGSPQFVPLDEIIASSVTTDESPRSRGYVAVLDGVS